MGWKQEVLDKLEKIDSKLEITSINIAVNNKILEEHHRRSTQLETRIIPLESSHNFVNKLSKVLASLVAVAAGLAAIYKYLFVK